MNKPHSFVFVLLLSALIGCAAPTPIRYTDAMFLELPSDPLSFQQSYGGTVQYSHPKASDPVQKGGNLDQATVTGNGFEAYFVKHQSYRLKLVVFSKNNLSIGGVQVIGKSPSEISAIFGVELGKIGDEVEIIGDTTGVVFEIVEGRVASCRWGIDDM